MNVIHEFGNHIAEKYPSGPGSVKEKVESQPETSFENLPGGSGVNNSAQNEHENAKVINIVQIIIRYI